MRTRAAKREPSSSQRQEFLERQPTYWLKRSYQALRRRVDDELRPTGVTLSQREALHAVRHNGPANQGQLVERLGLEQSSVSRLVDGLQRRGWVAVESDAKDRRARQVSLTPLGVEILSQTPGAAQIAGSIIAKSLPGGESEELIRLLKKCAQALETQDMDQINGASSGTTSKTIGEA